MKRLVTKRFVLEGTWRPDRSVPARVCHREQCTQSKAEWAKRTHSILFADGTSLELSVRECVRMERVRTIDGYSSLINDCFYSGVSSVQELQAIRRKEVMA